MTRIVAGSVGGRRLVTPKGETTRPTSERVREALFGSIESQGLLNGATVLDLYCGSGALALEAISRGAASAVLVDASREAVQAARENVAALGVQRVTVVLSSVQRYLANPAGTPSSLVFADPPYAMPQDELSGVLADLVGHGWLAAGGRLLVERSSRSVEPVWPAGVVRHDVRRYGETAVWHGRLTS
ncbi:16S rRNA (guanine(966)-N(2))-methyltransferase RsmD [Spongisporangium articulatum]|uniref:16S rRNA (Guanine(966)-N(2))-methyltransferase RsmD n=1 Tax=Spongisporangium articulatum TaxID=3362603 RepID=A0ABW8APB3_9ACTN